MSNPSHKARDFLLILRKLSRLDIAYIVVLMGRNVTIARLKLLEVMRVNS